MEPTIDYSAVKAITVTAGDPRTDCVSLTCHYNVANDNNDPRAPVSSTYSSWTAAVRTIHEATGTEFFPAGAATQVSRRQMPLTYFRLGTMGPDSPFRNAQSVTVYPPIIEGTGYQAFGDPGGSQGGSWVDIRRNLSIWVNCDSRQKAPETIQTFYARPQKDIDRRLQHYRPTHSLQQPGSSQGGGSGGTVGESTRSGYDPNDQPGQPRGY